MKLSQYNYSFSPDMLAKYPAESRDESRLMVLNRRTGKIEHKVFKEMIDYFRQGDVLVFNDTKVFPARLYGNKEKTGAEIEIFLLRELNRDLRLWDVLVDPARKIRIGNKLYFGDDDLMVDASFPVRRRLRRVQGGAVQTRRDAAAQVDTPESRTDRRGALSDDFREERGSRRRADGRTAFQQAPDEKARDQGRRHGLSDAACGIG